MQPKYLLAFLMLCASNISAQDMAVFDYKIKTAANAKPRTEILDALRAHIYNDLKMTLEFYVNHLKVSNNYAWFEGTADRTDGKDMRFPNDGEYDCCHVEALFRKLGDKWIVDEGAAFSTDVWYAGISKRYLTVPKAIFPENSPALLDVNAFNLLKIVEKKGMHPYNTKLVHALKDKKGGFLGNVYIEDFKNDIFNKLLITKQKDGKTDTLYFIYNCLFTNPKGIDITFGKENFNGYKIDFMKDDSIQLFGIGKNGSGASDPATIIWNYRKRIFEVYQTP